MKRLTKILLLGVSGMLGHTLFSMLFNKKSFETYATSRNKLPESKYFTSDQIKKITLGVDVDKFDLIQNIITGTQPDLVINCIGIIKQLPEAKNFITSISVNALFPHRLALTCKKVGARLIHFSTDCVFSGKVGNYTEDDFSDADDLYGRTKYLGELHEPHCITLRTSIIGHELKSKHGLIEWFLNENNPINGYARAIFSGFPTVEIARIVADYVVPNEELTGLYHVSSEPISKHELLKLIAEQYDHKITIKPYDDFVCDRSLNSEKFKTASGYNSPSWKDLVTMMHDDFVRNERR